jgi:hypothetical protein
MGRALRPLPELVEQNGRPRDYEPCDEPNVIACEFDELSHEFVVVPVVGQYTSAAWSAPREANEIPVEKRLHFGPVCG